MTDCAHERTWMVRVWISGGAEDVQVGVVDVCRACGLFKHAGYSEWCSDKTWWRGLRYELLPPHPAVTEPPAALVAELERLRAELADARKLIAASAAPSAEFARPFSGAEFVDAVLAACPSGYVDDGDVAARVNAIRERKTPPAEPNHAAGAAWDRVRLAIECDAANVIVVSDDGPWSVVHVWVDRERQLQLEEDFAAHERDVAKIGAALRDRRAVEKAIDWTAFFWRRTRLCGDNDYVRTCASLTELPVRQTIRRMDEMRGQNG